MAARREGVNTHISSFTHCSCIFFTPHILSNIAATSFSRRLKWQVWLLLSKDNDFLWLLSRRPILHSIITFLVLPSSSQDKLSRHVDLEETKGVVWSQASTKIVGSSISGGIEIRQSQEPMRVAVGGSAHLWPRSSSARRCECLTKRRRAVFPGDAGLG